MRPWESKVLFTIITITMYVYYFKKKKKLSENLSKEDDREVPEEEDTER